jgi:D-alanyl-D-alanine carboxypeptidase
MKHMPRAFMLIGTLLMWVQSIYAHDVRLTQVYLAEIMDEARNRYKIPAIAVTIMNSEDIYLKEVQGVRVVDQSTHATLDDFFHLGSCSKSVLALIAAKMVEQKAITWQTRFFDLFPELSANADEAYSSITLEDLLLCEAGIKPFTHAEVEQFPIFDSSIRDKRLEFIKYLVRQRPLLDKENGRFPYLYSNASYLMASAMLEKVSGLTYEELVKETLNQNLSISTHIGWPNSLSYDQPWGHSISNGTIEAFSPEHEYKIPYLITPAGDLSMTPKDYAKYTQLHLQGLRGHSNYISSESYRHIHFIHEGFSLGVVNGSWNGIKYSGFDGSAGTFYCRSIIIPESDFAFTIMINAGSPNGSSDAVEWVSRKIIEKQYDLNFWEKFWLWLWW